MKPLGGVAAGASPTEALKPGLVAGAGLVGVFAAEFVAGLAGAELTGGLVRATVVVLLAAESGLEASAGGLLRVALSGRCCVSGRTGAGASPAALSGRFCVAGRTGAGASPAALLGAG